MTNRKVKAPAATSDAPKIVCLSCNPSDQKRAELGSSIGAYRHQHYLHDFKSTDNLEHHLRQTSHFPKPDSGLDFDSWLSGILHWHRQKRAAIADDNRRFPEKTGQIT